MPCDAITLGFILSADDTGNFHGRDIRDTVPLLLTENTELHYRLAPGTHWVAFQIGRAALENTGIFLP